MKFKDRAPVEELCGWAEIARSSVYYRAHPGERGMRITAIKSILELEIQKVICNYTLNTI